MSIDNKNKVKVEGHRGTWYVVDELLFIGKTYYLLEHNTYGNDVAWVAVDYDGNLVMEDIWGGVEELLDFLDEQLCQPTAEDVHEWQNWI